MELSAEFCAPINCVDDNVASKPDFALLVNFRFNSSYILLAYLRCTSVVHNPIIP
jgi:hypothetical protein